MGSWFGYGSTPKVEELPKIGQTQRGLPASWYRSEDLYQLERRAIFSKRWLLTTHRLRFEQPGDFLRFQEAGFEFFLVMDRDRNLNGFHNVCRHRAYPLVQTDKGNAKILACKYHGWSYGLKGNLAKAPEYQDLPAFDKSKSGLFPIHVHIDKLGFVWVNLEVSEKPSIKWEDDFAAVDTQKRFELYDISKYKFDHCWEMDTQFNWKALADNYNECYHCPTTHPDVSSLTDLDVYFVETQGCHIQHVSKNKGADNNTYKLASTFYFPNVCMTISPNFFYMMRATATSATTCHMDYQVFRHVDATDEDFKYIDSIFKNIQREDKDLCNAAQRNLSAGVFVSGELNPRVEKGSLYVQSTVKRMVKAHFGEEQRVGHQIWPTQQNTAGLEEVNEDEAFCKNVAACAAQKNSASLAW